MTDDNRFITIETKVAHQEFLLDELNQVVYEQQKQIDLLEKKLALMVKRVEGALSSDDDIRPAGEKPPHY